MSERPVIVQKFGGSSVRTTEKLARVADKVVATHRQGNAVAVVVSAMGDTTDELLARAGELAENPERRELDLLLSTGEQISSSLLAMAIQGRGVPAVALTGPQCGILTNDVHSNARILAICPERARAELAAGRVVVVAGYQGASERGDVTTLGRGGSDTTAVALAAALPADRCEIYTDVEGVWSADPRLVDDARHLAQVPHVEMEELAWQGARVLKAEAVEFARDNGIDVVVRSTFGGDRETRISTPAERDAKTWVPRRSAVAGVAGRKDLVRLRVGELGRDRWRAQEFFDELAKYDLVSGSLGQRGELYLSTEEIPDLAGFRRDLGRRFGAFVEVSDRLGAAALVGFGLGSRPHAFYAALRALEDGEVAVEASFSTRESLTFVLEVREVDRAVHLLHRSFVTAREAEIASYDVARV